MGYVKDIFIETMEELEFVASGGDQKDIDAVTAYLKGETGSTHGVLSPTFESNLDMDPIAFRDVWGRILAGEEDPL
jgi:hypothetical protein